MWKTSISFKEDTVASSTSRDFAHGRTNTEFKLECYQDPMANNRLSLLGREFQKAVNSLDSQILQYIEAGSLQYIRQVAFALPSNQ